MNWSRERLKEMARTALWGSYGESLVASVLLSTAAGSYGAFSSGFGRGMGSAGGQNGHHGGGDSQVGELFQDVFRGPAAALVIAAIILGILVLVALKIVILNAVEAGCSRFFAENVIRPARLGRIGTGFKGNFKNVVKTMFLRDLYLFLWTMLLIIPGIIKSYEYRMVPYLISEYPDLDTKAVFALSREMMRGEKWNAFLLDLSFIGWILLGAVTCGIVLIFYTQPYMLLTQGALYDALKQNYEQANGPVRNFASAPI
jgi:hypothetical protein